MKKSSFFLINQSYWPVMARITTFSGFRLFFQFLVNEKRFYCIRVNFLLKGFYIFLIRRRLGWRNDFLTESTFLGLHTQRVQRNIKIGFILFLVSEVMLFFAFFWALFHSRLNPSTFIGNIWPPKGIIPLSPLGIPLLNTVLLISSGIYLTTAHIRFVTNSSSFFFLTARQTFFFFRSCTILAGFVFLLLQRFEYINATFDISDSIYGSIFFMLTGLHGFHVLVGLFLLRVRFIRQFFYHYTVEHAIHLECAIWYWHFVDIVWIFLYFTIYIRL